jgi:GntR family transcriptional regulator/MocR family aminotransferase
VSRRGKVFVPSIDLDKASETPLSRQIYGQIARSIRGGNIPSGTRLPSSRMLARLLGVSRNTVLAAFDDLAADDLLRGEKGGNAGAEWRACAGSHVVRTEAGNSRGGISGESGGIG